MDANKLRVLRVIRYKVLPTCALCKNGWFPQNDWGTCGAHKYQHEKHTGDLRQLSIHKQGSCPSFEAKPNTNLGLFQEFLDAPR